jgi:hypothetical protein
MNLYRGVGTADGATLALALDEGRICGQVTVQDWKAISCDCFPIGGTALTSAVCKYW